jgi:hypothetical protein
MNNVAKLKPDDVPLVGLALLRAPFPDHQVSKLPKETRKQADDRKRDQAAGNWPAKCNVCGGLHHPRAVHLDYVGHAALTDRLLDSDPMWTWEPASLRDGLPAFDNTGGLWIRLTVCGVTRLGYGHAAEKPQMEPGAREKEVIGDALRNAAMRFGAALDLWHKGDLHVDEQESPPLSAEQQAINHLDACAIDASIFKDAWLKNKDAWKNVLGDDAYARVVAVMKRHSAKFSTQPAPPPPAPAAQSNPFDISDDLIPF